MSGSISNTTKPGVPLSSLPSIETPKPVDLIFGIFDGKGQFVPQAKVWNGAVDKDGDTITGALSATYIPTDPQHLVPKAYVDAQGDKIAGKVTEAVSGQVSTALQAAQTANLAATTANNAAAGAANAASIALDAQKGKNNGIVAISADGHLVLGGFSIFGTTPDGHLLLILDLPTSDPNIKNAWWNNGGYFCISQGA